MQLRTVVEDYVNAALRSAVVETLDDGTLAAYVPLCKGVLAFGADVHECAVELYRRLEDWVKASLARGDTLPVIDAIDLNIEARRLLVTYHSAEDGEAQNDVFDDEHDLEAAFDRQDRSA